MFVFVNEINSQDLVVDGTENTVAFNGTYQDFILPDSQNVAELKFTIKGGDGGKQEESLCCGLSCKAKGGVGAITTAFFDVGDNPGQIPRGSTVRFVVGGKGESDGEPGGGGGGTGVLYKAPESDTWNILAVAGGGGGGIEVWIIFCLTEKNGQGGRAGTSGGDGNGDIAPGAGGSNGEGGEAGGAALLEVSGGGGGAYSAGEGVLCNDLNFNFTEGWGGQAGFPAGGAGGTPHHEAPGGGVYICYTSGSNNGGFGFGGGGAGIVPQHTPAWGGGGGGGYSGGGGGGTSGRGGGGGSFVNEYGFDITISEGGNTSSPANGWAKYQVVLNTPPVAECVTSSQIVALDASGNASIQPSLVDGGSYDPDDDPITMSVSPSTFSCDDVGENTVTLTVMDDRGAVDECDAIVLIQDITPPTMICKDISVNLNSSGLAFIEENSVDDGSWDACGILSYDTDITEFNCQDAYNYLQDGIPITVTMTVTDVNGNINSCPADVTVLYSENDADCDNVGDECDLCPNGDDSMDYNNDGYPDCYGPYFPGYEDLHPDWTCANNPNQEKLYVCHRPPGNEENFQQICIKMSALSAHLDHGDFIGPCIDCPETMERRAAEFDIQTEIGGFEVYPNPVTDHMYVKVLQLIEGNAQIRISNYLGEIISLIDYPYETETPLIEVDLDTKFISGLYFITLIQDQQIWTKQVIVLK